MEYPDSQWYANRSAKERVSKNCPIAACDKCPRHYLSLKLINTVYPGAMNLAPENRDELDAKWKNSPPFANEDSSCGVTTTATGDLLGVSGFCPEVTDKYLGLYCASLFRFVDEDHKNSAMLQLQSEGASQQDPRHEWALCWPVHFTDCGEYSVYGGGPGSNRSSKKSKKGISSRVRWQVFDRDSFTCQYCGAKGSASAPLQVDHRVPRAAGGGNELENLVTACEKCNSGKGAKELKL